MVLADSVYICAVLRLGQASGQFIKIIAFSAQGAELLIE